MGSFCAATAGLSAVPPKEPADLSLTQIEISDAEIEGVRHDSVFVKVLPEKAKKTISVQGVMHVKDSPSRAALLVNCLAVFGLVLCWSARAGSEWHSSLLRSDLSLQGSPLTPSSNSPALLCTVSVPGESSVLAHAPAFLRVRRYAIQRPAGESLRLRAEHVS